MVTVEATVPQVEVGLQALEAELMAGLRKGEIEVQAVETRQLEEFATVEAGLQALEAEMIAGLWEDEIEVKVVETGQMVELNFQKEETLKMMK